MPDFLKFEKFRLGLLPKMFEDFGINESVIFKEVRNRLIKN